MKMKVFIATLLLPLMSFALEGVVPLAGTDTNLGDADLKVVDELVSPHAGVIGIGESVHGSAEFQKMRLRLIKYYVEKKGVRVITLEQAAGSNRFITNYVLGKTDDLSSFTSSERTPIYDDFKSKEFIETMDYVREFNRTHPRDKVYMYGIDLWETFYVTFELEDYIKKYFPAKWNDIWADAMQSCMHLKYANRNEKWLDSLMKYANGPEIAYLKQNKMVEPNAYLKCTGSLLTLEQYFNEHRKVLSALTGKYSYTYHKILSRILRAYIVDKNWIYRDFKQAEQTRNRAQAENVADLHWLHGKRTLFLAHNIHITNNQTDAFVDNVNPWAGSRVAGEWLKKLLGASGYQSIAITGYDLGGVQYKDPLPVPTSEKSLDLKLHNAGEKVCLVDPNTKWIKTAGNWYMEFEDLNGGNGYLHSPHKSFEAIIYIDKSGIITRP